MGRKKCVSLLAAAAVWLMLVTTGMAQGVAVLAYGRIAVAMPDITAEIKGSHPDAASAMATLGTETLTVQEAHPYDKARDTTRAYILVDLSTSMQGSFDLVKQNILTYIDQMGDRDSLVLITFGEEKVDVLLQGDEPKRNRRQAVEALQCSEDGTLFYEALSRAYQLSNASISGYDREYVLAFSDGIDFQKGSTTYAEVTGAYKTHALPVYAACSPTSYKEDADRFGELARSSGGSMAFVEDEDTFDALLDDIHDVTILKLAAANNIADGQSRQLAVKIGDLQVEQTIPVTRSRPDTVPPSVTALRYDAGQEVILVSYSEKVNGALSAAAYRLTDPDGKRVTILSVEPAQAENTVEIKPQSIRNGAYTLTFQGITDMSQEANALNETKTLRVDNAPAPPASFPVWAIVLLAAGGVLIVAGVVLTVVLATRKRQPTEPENVPTLPITPPVQANVMEHVPEPPAPVKHHIQAEDARRIHLKIKTGRTSEQHIETSIVGSLIVGRSDVCDIYIDDSKLSRQHFVIENDAGDFYIMDLQSKNGTMLNGIRINSRQPLHSGDKIMAGLSDITITMLGR